MGYSSQITTAPTVTSLTDVMSNGTDLDAGQTVTFTLTASETLAIGAGTALTLNNGATAVYNSSSGDAEANSVNLIFGGFDPGCRCRSDSSHRHRLRRRMSSFVTRSSAIGFVGND